MATVDYDTPKGGGQLTVNIPPPGPSGPSVQACLVVSASPFKMAAGTAALTGTNPTAIATGLVSIAGVSITLQGNVAPGDNTSILTYDFIGGTLNIYAWKNTAGNDPTLVASAGTDTFSWLAVGF